jgi:hypothetical protein
VAEKAGETLTCIASTNGVKGHKANLCLFPAFRNHRGWVTQAERLLLEKLLVWALKIRPPNL